jgi:hypothetical protein
MAIKNTFPFSSRWNSIGLDCSFCRHQAAEPRWPLVDRRYKCDRHGVPMAVQVGRDGYKVGEWFCSDFEDNGRAHPEAVAHFRGLKARLAPRVLYGLHTVDGHLSEISFEELDKYV